MSLYKASHQTVRPFSTTLLDVRNLHVVSKARSRDGLTGDEILEKARLEAHKQGQVEGFMEGLAQGRTEGFAQGRQEAYEDTSREATRVNTRELQELLSATAEYLADANAEIPAWFQRAEQAMTDRTMEILRRLLAAELVLSRDHVVDIVREALSEVTHAQHVRIKLNPVDRAKVAEHKDELMCAASQLRDIEIVDDPMIEGGCVVESEGGLVDARFSTRLDLIAGDLAA